MSRGLENLLPFIEPVTSDYPWGDIKDDTGPGDGTNMNRYNLADHHQTWRKLLALAFITPNNLPDNVTNGYQYVNALDKLYKKFTGVLITDVDSVLVQSDLGKMIIISASTGPVVITLPPSTSLRDGDSFFILNDSGFSVSVVRQVPDAIKYNGIGGVSLELPFINDYAEFVLDEPNTDWYVSNSKISTSTIPVLVGSGGAPAFGGGWDAPSAPPLSFFKDNSGYIGLNGIAHRNGGGGVSTIFTLPSGFRPATNKKFPVCVDDNGTNKIIHCNVGNLGNVSVDLASLSGTGDTYITFDSVNFYTGV